uniref:VPS37 C-terminal domain-containing protein n=1 Tax=Chromera velia CCMP2878 TaxID=1169474 RepID=A0A0G4HH09_9ALVE|eukprot:Cvel_27504.t1-p1 / transcript=Cvel_27504.t1 / gene=Cvel_27504 / organism=Chromera_velia_CCMP2878 / gene_product=hypothetical protein / transcript_product=hypothetical protein / location=Cvel_scaffold3441:14204-17032(-) / protein_length=196 / sequence_SO=supercontig / SO=protein_coding / is_pseudo=false
MFRAAPPSYDDQSPSTGKSRKERERASVPPCPDLSFIDKMSQDELEFYESNPEAVDDMILETAEAQSILTMSRDLLQKNEELATKILSKEEEAEAVQKKAHEKWAEMSLERDKLAGLLREQDELISRFDKTRIAEALAKEASELETGGDAMKRSFASLVGGGVKNATDIETFKRDFLQKRKEFHAVEARKEKLERV